MTENLSGEADRLSVTDRVMGVVLASAAGDALGSQYEFGPSLTDTEVVSFGQGYFGHAPGEWTDDTSMAMPILLELSRGEVLSDSETLRRIVESWHEWSLTALDVGVQTKAVLSSLDEDYTEEHVRDVSRGYYERTLGNGGNGSLMRTGPIALGYLGDGDEEALVNVAGRVAQLTHWENDNVDASVIWCLAIRHAIRTGELDIRGQLSWIPDERRDRWVSYIDAALAPGVHPRDFLADNDRVVRAFQGALAAVSGAEARGGDSQVVNAVERAVRGGGDADTVAAIAGSLAGALWGAAQVPAEWSGVLHGWPTLTSNDLKELAIQATLAG